MKGGIFIDTFDLQELLKNALEEGIINISDVQEKLKMSKMQKILDMHKFKIWQGDNGFWYTYLPDEKKPNKRRLIKKKSEAKIHELLLDYYDTKEDECVTFKDCFLLYTDVKSEYVANNTLSKYANDYKRFFENTWLETYDITAIMGDRLEAFIIKRIKDLHLNQKAAKAMIGYIKSVFMYAVINHIIKENPCNYLKKGSSYFRYCSAKIVNTKDRIADTDEIAAIMEAIKQDHIKKPEYIPSYAVELSILTGMRVGEIAALTWDSIDDDVIIVNKEEIFDRSNNSFYVADYTKNRRPRLIPITKNIRALLEKVKEVETALNCYGKYIFMNQHGKINKRAISDCARNKSIQAGLKKSKSISCFRRTVNSTIKNDGISTTVAAAIIGNTIEVNEQHYTYDVTDMEEKREILEKANNKMLLKVE